MSSSARPATGFAVDGIAPARVARPQTVSELQELLAQANAAGGVVVPWGGGTQMGFGNVPAEVATVVDLTALNHVAEYEPSDLTIGVQAGMRVAELERVLGEHGQFLPVETADPEQATIGGLFATGIAGPRRFGFGSLRDLVLGISVVLPEGRLAKGGGMVVKNVTGFDMMRLNYGALGSLGVIVRLNFKTLPRPRAERTVLARFKDQGAAFAAGMAVRASTLGPSAIVVLNGDPGTATAETDAGWLLAIRCEAPALAVEQQAARVRDMVASAGDIALREDEASSALWHDVQRALDAGPSRDRINVRIGERPSLLASVTDAAAHAAHEAGLAPQVMADLGTGLVYLRASGAVERLSEAWSKLIAHGQHSSLLTAPAVVKADTDVFGRMPAGFAVMESLKEQFDPRRILNRGRFIGHL